MYLIHILSLKPLFCESYYLIHIGKPLANTKSKNFRKSENFMRKISHPSFVANCCVNEMLENLWSLSVQQTFVFYPTLIIENLFKDYQR